jgi:hypothetical protein
MRANSRGSQIIERCHVAPYGGHCRVFGTQTKIWQCGFFCPMMYEDTKEFIRRCRKYQFQGSINSRIEMSLHYNLQIEIFDVWALTSWGHFKSLKIESISSSLLTTCKNRWKHVTDQRNYTRLSKKIFHRGG